MAFFSKKYTLFPEFCLFYKYFRLFLPLKSEYITFIPNLIT